MPASERVTFCLERQFVSLATVSDGPPKAHGCTRVPVAPHSPCSGDNPAIQVPWEEVVVVPNAVPVKRRWQSGFAALAWGTSTLAFVIAGACLSYATVLEVDRLTRLTTPTPPEVAHDVIVRNAQDQAGHRASFRVLLFTDEFRWRLSSYESLEQLEEPAFTPEMKNVLNRAKEIIAVGASSEEIVPGLSGEAGRKREEARAGRRAERIAMWVRQAISSPIPVRKLNVGHHMPTKGFKETSDQRRVVIILVLEREEGTNVDQALRAAMALESINAPIFEALLTRYSLSANKAFTWVE
jgi:hypothetical protein